MEVDGPTNGRWSRVDWSIVLILMLLALATRGYGLAEGSLQVDEYYTVYRAEQRATNLFNPAYNALAITSFRLLGVNEFSARLPAMLLGALGIPVLFALYRSIIGRFAALVAALITVTSSWHLWHSQFARYYAGVFLFGAVAYFLLFRAIRRGSYRYLAGGLLALAVAVAFHATSVVIGASLTAYCLVRVLAGRANLSPRSKQVVGVYLALSAIGLLAALPYGWQMASAWYSSGQSWGYGPFGLLLQTAKYVQIPVAVCACLGVLLFFREDFWAGWFLALGTGIPLIALVVASAVTSVRPDYLMYSLPLVHAAAGYTCALAFRVARTNRFVGLALTVVLLAGMVPEMASHYSGRASLHIQDIVRFIDRSYEPGDRILSFVTGVDHYSEDRYSMEHRPGNASDSSLDWNGILDPYLETEGRLWIVVSARRKPLARGLESWLRQHAQMKWRKFEKRFDYTYRGYEVFLASGKRDR